jgi:hypothetical protein
MLIGGPLLAFVIAVAVLYGPEHFRFAQRSNVEGVSGV